MVWWPQTYSLRTLILFWSIFKSLFICVDKIQVFPSSFCLIRMQGSDSENRTVSLGWSYLFQTYGNSIIDIFIIISESFNSSLWDKASQYSEYHFCLGSENFTERALGGIRGQPIIFSFFCNSCKYLSSALEAFRLIVTTQRQGHPLSNFVCQQRLWPFSGVSSFVVALTLVVL